MKQLTLNLGLTMVLTACSTVSAAQPRIAWYGTLESGLAAAEKRIAPFS